MSNAVFIRDGRVRLVNPNTGMPQTVINTTGRAVAASSDGEFVVVLTADGRVTVHDAETGVFRRGIQGHKVTGCSITQGVIVLTSSEGPACRYDASTGASLGMIV